MCWGYHLASVIDFKCQHVLWASHATIKQTEDDCAFMVVKLTKSAPSCCLKGLFFHYHLNLIPVSELHKTAAHLAPSTI